MELNAEQIIKALECCSPSGKHCTECVYFYRAVDDICVPYLMADARALINSQEQRIKKLTDENERLRAENTKYEAEVHAQFDKWLKLEEATKRHHAELFEEAKIAVKADTVRKMQERLLDNIKGSNIDAVKNVCEWINYHAEKMLEGADED